MGFCYNYLVIFLLSVTLSTILEQGTLTLAQELSEPVTQPSLTQAPPSPTPAPPSPPAPTPAPPSPTPTSKPVVNSDESPATKPAPPPVKDENTAATTPSTKPAPPPTKRKFSPVPEAISTKTPKKIPFPKEMLNSFYDEGKFGGPIENTNQFDMEDVSFAPAEDSMPDGATQTTSSTIVMSVLLGAFLFVSFSLLIN
ncbi:anther-specific proline-rich protein APG-like [Gigantopelta aegis]|uniref:anther-specific proline-rich protein APG-like n=1 Tax=Gigantopelta aegis TaxID=1735272 RepID=UPI001B88C4E8|nr:anther-specific proline-rich protein APG-like [Gigantopelta aegis]